MTRYYFDSGVFITPIIKNREQRVIDRFIEWQTRMKEGEIEAFTSCLTWDELVYVVQKRNGKELAERIGKRFIQLANIEFIAADEDIIKGAQDLLEKSNVRPRDSIHAFSSLVYAEGNIVTLDVERSDFRRFKNNDQTPLLNIVEIR